MSFKNNFIYFYYLLLTPLGFCSCMWLSLVAASRDWGGAWAPCCGLSCCWAWTLGYVGFSSWGMWVQKLQLLGSRAQAQQLWHAGLVALQHVGSSWVRDRAHVSYMSMWILWTTREAQTNMIFVVKNSALFRIREHVHLRLIPVDVWQKPPQYCKIISLQLKKTQHWNACH